VWRVQEALQLVEMVALEWNFINLYFLLVVLVEAHLLMQQQKEAMVEKVDLALEEAVAELEALMVAVVVVMAVQV
jgi:hypothetical protein